MKRLVQRITGEKDSFHACPVDLSIARDDADLVADEAVRR